MKINRKLKEDIFYILLFCYLALSFLSVVEYYLIIEGRTIIPLKFIENLLLIFSQTLIAQIGFWTTMGIMIMWVLRPVVKIIQYEYYEWRNLE